MKQLIESIDFDSWCNAKRDIIIALLERSEIESVAEVSRIIGKGYAVTYQHLTDLHISGIVLFGTKQGSNRRVLKLKKKDIEKIFKVL